MLVLNSMYIPIYWKLLILRLSDYHDTFRNNQMLSIKYY